MGKYVINGGNKLVGDIDIQGSKNSALAILIATLVTSGETVLSNVPDIADVRACIDILRYYGANVQYCDQTTLKIDTESIEYRSVNTALTSKLRASSYLLGALTARFGRCDFEQSGGCNFGMRPLDLHFYALKQLGADEINGEIRANGRLIGSKIDFKSKTVGGTVNAIIAASRADGVTVIKNAAKEPHICDLACFLNNCGAEIIGAGGDTVTVIGKKRLHGCRYRIDADMIEAGTFLIASLVTGGKIRCKNAPISELDATVLALKRIGANIHIDNGCITATADKIFPTNIITAPYPDFPTDLQPQACVLLGLASGESSIKETVFESRFEYTKELKKAGLLCDIKENVLRINGRQNYICANMQATDLRGGAAMVLAALNASGKSFISSTEIIERGYSDFVEKLASLGADIKRG